MTDKTYTGVVQYFNNMKHFGFLSSEIIPGQNPIDIFFHIANITNSEHTPQIGDVATFTLVKDSKGRVKAYDVFLSEGKEKDTTNE